MSARYLLLIICLLCLHFPAGPALAASEIERLNQRINKLEKELKELKEILKQQQQTKEEEKIRVQKLEQKMEKVSTSGLNKFTIKPYGYIKLDAAYDDSRTTPGNFVLFVPNESANKNDNEFNMTARQTRLGLQISAPKIYSWEATGRIEIDFYGDGTRHENKAEPLLRHAYLEVKKGNFSILAGQTSDVISPLFLNTLNYTVGWTAGNIGYRRPQLRLTYVRPVNENSQLTGAIAFARTTGTINEDLDLDTQNDGDDAGFPTVQARLALATRILTEQQTVLGISGHYGEEEIDWALNPLTSGSRQERVKSWSLNTDLDAPLTRRLSVKAEAFVGYNLDEYFGGIFQGVNPTTQEVIKTAGGFLQVSYNHNEKWKYHVGLSIEDAQNSDLSAGMRSRNSLYFGNMVYSPIPPLDLGIEYSYWETEYIKGSAGTDNRLQTSLIYKW